MKPVPVFLIAMLITLSGNAQDAAPSSVDLQSTPAPLPLETPSNTPFPSAPQLPDLSRLDEAFKRSSIGKAADENRQRIEIRLLQNRIANDPDIVAAKKEAETARTDLEKRERLRAYYELTYDRMRHSASSEGTRKALDDEEAAHLRRLEQPRVRPAPGGTVPPVDKKAKVEKKKKSHLGRITGS